MLGSSIHVLRMLALSEGISFLLLLGVAMPLKYMAGLPLAVLVVGWIHGVLFTLFCLALAYVYFKHRWSFLRAAGVFVAALLPFGPFVIDRRMKVFQKADL